MTAHTATDIAVSSSPIGSSRGRVVAVWALQLVVVAVLLIAGPIPKLTGAEATIALFTELGAEPFGRIGIGIAEAIALVLLLTPWTALYGAGLTVGLMGGAIMGHLTKLGVSISPDLHPDLAGPGLFVMAVVAMLAATGVLVLRRREIPIISSRLA